MKNESPRLETSPQLRRRMTEIAREFRKAPTKGEAMLWQALRGKKLDGIKFRRQQPIGFFIVDFYNSVYRLAIEVDGPVHDAQTELDLARQTILEELGLNILRIRTESVESDLPSALAIIRNKVKELKSQHAKFPSPVLGEGQGGG